MISFAVLSCSKDSTAPTITITSPSEGSTLLRGQTYPVIGKVTDDSELSEIVAGGVTITTFDSKTSHVLANLDLEINQRSNQTPLLHSIRHLRSPLKQTCPKTYQPSLKEADSP